MIMHYHMELPCTHKRGTAGWVSDAIQDGAKCAWVYDLPSLVKPAVVPSVVYRGCNGVKVESNES